MLTDYSEQATALFIHVIGQANPPDIPVFHPSQPLKALKVEIGLPISCYHP